MACRFSHGFLDTRLPSCGGIAHMNRTCGREAAHLMAVWRKKGRREIHGPIVLITDDLSSTRFCL